MTKRRSLDDAFVSQWHWQEVLARLDESFTVMWQGGRWGKPVNNQRRKTFEPLASSCSSRVNAVRTPHPPTHTRQDPDVPCNTYTAEPKHNMFEVALLYCTAQRALIKAGCLAFRKSVACEPRARDHQTEKVGLRLETEIETERKKYSNCRVCGCKQRIYISRISEYKLLDLRAAKLSYQCASRKKRVKNVRICQLTKDIWITRNPRILDYKHCDRQKNLR